MSEGGVIGDEAAGEDVGAAMDALGAKAKRAAQALAIAAPEAKRAALRAAADRIAAAREPILAANAADMAEGRAKGLNDALLDRLALSPSRIAAIADAVRAVADLPDPVGAEMAAWTQPSGLRIRRVRTPLGVVGVIYESRPNVTADAGALCFKSGNAVILRGGSESFHSSRAIHAAMAEGLAAAGAPEHAVQLTPTRDRAAVGHMLENMAGVIDVIVPRGGRSLVERVQTTARVPVFAHLEGICHVFVHEGAEADVAARVLANAKMRRTSICGAAECALFDRAALARLGPPVLDALIAAGAEVRGDDAVRALDPRVKPAAEEDFGQEFLGPVIAAAAVDGVEGAAAHIARFGSSHTDAIVTADDGAWDRFQRLVDSAIVMRNASTQFADGGEFGMGAEIGIATGRMHARGPVGLEQLTSFKYVVEGPAEGAVRP